SHETPRRRRRAAASRALQEAGAVSVGQMNRTEPSGSVFVERAGSVGAAPAVLLAVLAPSRRHSREGGSPGLWWFWIIPSGQRTRCLAIRLLFRLRGSED